MIALTVDRSRCTENTIKASSQSRSYVPFGGTLDPDNRWMLFSSLMLWQEPEARHASQFSSTTSTLAMSDQLAYDVQFIKQRLGMTACVIYT
jgi:hypothetical protein